MHTVMSMNNKIIITDNNIDINIDESITFNNLSEKDSLITKISLDILNDSLLEIEYNIEENKKINVVINVSDNVKFTLIDKKQGNDYKVKYDYKLGKNSDVVIDKINDAHIVKENEIFNLNGENSRLNYIILL